MHPNVRGDAMKYTPILCIAVFGVSCATRPSFHSEILAGHTCEATYYLVGDKLEEAADTFIKEFARLQRNGTATRESRLGLLGHGTHHFPKEKISMLYPLLDMGCRDQDAKVRTLAMGLLVEYFGESVIGDLRRMSENATPEVRAHIITFIEGRTAKEKTAPNTPAQGMLRSAPQP
jgi:hypothetical protein